MRKKRFHYRQLSYFKKAYNLCSAAYKYYFCAGHHEQKNQKTTVQIKFSAATLNYQIKRLNDIPYVNKCQCFGSSVAVAQFHLYFLSSQITHNSILLLLLETHNALHMPVFFFSFSCQPYLKYGRIRSKKIFYRTSNS